MPDNKEALALSEREADEASLWATFSRGVGGGKWKGVPGAAISSADSVESTLGVPVIVPQVINLFTAAGPNCEAVGDGTDGSRGNDVVVAVLTYDSPAIAAPILLRVGLAGTSRPVLPSSFDCSGNRVFACLMILGTFSRIPLGKDVGPSYGDRSASGGNMRAFRVLKAQPSTLAVRVSFWGAVTSVGTLKGDDASEATTNSVPGCILVTCSLFVLWVSSTTESAPESVFEICLTSVV